MWISQLQLRQFRNYDQLHLTLDPHQNLIIGVNAAGKSNILEAICYVSHGKSMRTRADRELIQWQQTGTFIQVTAESVLLGPVTVEAQITVSPENRLKTVFKTNGQPVKSRSEIIGKIPTVTFFLSDLQMLRGVPEDRRNAVDSALVQWDMAHFKRLALYNRVRQQKSQWLKQDGPRNGTVLDSLNQQLASLGAEVMVGRMAYLAQLYPALIQRHAELATDAPDQAHRALTLAYQPSWPLSSPWELQLDVMSIEAQLSQAIERVSAEEQRRGQVLVGPHRDDIRFALDDKDAIAYGSQGQQRSIVLAFKLAEIALLEARLHGETPILLLDDVMAELDPTRQAQLLAHLNPATQVLLTTTHLSPELQSLNTAQHPARIFHVTQGLIENTAPGVALS